MGRYDKVGYLTGIVRSHIKQAHPKRPHYIHEKGAATGDRQRAPILSKLTRSWTPVIFLLG